LDWFFVSRLRVVSARLSRLVVVSLEVTVLSLTSLSQGSGWIRPMWMDVRCVSCAYVSVFSSSLVLEFIHCVALI
jgi:hypothetical protein